MAGGRVTSWRVHDAMAGWGARRRAWETLWVPGRGQDPNQAAATDGRRREERPVSPCMIIGTGAPRAAHKRHSCAS